MAPKIDRVNNITNLIVDKMLGKVNTIKMRKASQYMMGSNLTISPEKKLIRYFKNVLYADLMLNRLLITTKENMFEIYPIWVNEINSFPTLVSYKQSYPPIGLPCHTWGENCSFIIGSGTGTIVLIIDVESSIIIEEIDLYEDEPVKRWSTMGHEVCPYNNNLIAVGCKVGKVPVIDLRTGNIESVMKEKFPDVNSISWSRFHENIIALTSSFTETLQIWDIRHLRHHYTSIDYPSNVPPNLQFLNHSTLISLRDIGVDFIDVFKENISYSLPLDICGGSSKRKQFAFDSLSYPQFLYIPSSNSLDVYDLAKDSLINSYSSSLFPPEIVLMNEFLQEVYSLAPNEVTLWKQSFQ
ncbi:hypothetical protein O3M35_003864 [Rhynocoris fuscipes]|uniref:Uncharacterized protein n=1 Tax=Rhynocoris fuscipes TaxID=488301 RepID=A0AAW1CHU8_9HEMI